MTEHHISSSGPGVGRTIHPGSVARNTLLIFLTQVFTRIAGLATSILLANYLGTAQFGIYNYAFALTALFVPLCDLGMDTYILRTLSRNDSHDFSKEIETVLGGKLLLTAFDFLMIVMISAWMEPFGSSSFIIICFAAIVTFLRSYWTTFSSFFRALNRINYDVGIFSAIRIAEFSVIAVTIIFEQSIIGLLSGFAIINLVGILLTFSIVNRDFARIKLFCDFSRLKASLRQSLPFATTAIFVTVYFNLDTVLVKLIVNESSAGIYRAAYNLVIPMLMVSSSATAAIFPYVSQNQEKNIEQVQNIVNRVSSYLMMVALPVAVIVSFMAPAIISWLFKPAFWVAGDTLRILIWFLPVAYLTNLFGNVLGAMDHQKYVMKVSGGNMIFNIVANLILIPVFAHNGAAATTVLTELLGLSFLFFKMKRTLGKSISLEPIIKSLSSAIFTIPFLIFGIGLHPMILVGIAVAVYVGGIFLLKAISFAEIKQLINTLRNRDGFK